MAMPISVSTKAPEHQSHSTPLRGLDTRLHTRHSTHNNTHQPMFTASDVKVLFRSWSSQTSPSSLLPPPPPCLELSSGDGVLLERSARALIQQRISCCDNNPRTRTSVFELASELSLEPRVVERLLPADREGWGRIGVSTIVKSCEYDRLLQELRKELEAKVVQVSEFCCRNEIDSELFRRLLEATAEEWQSLGHDRAWVFTTNFYKARQLEVAKSLEDTTRPTEISAVLQYAELPVTFLLKIVSVLVKSRALRGTVEAGWFVPEIYVWEKRDAVIEEFRRDRIIAVEALRELGVDDPQEFIVERVPSAHLLEQHFVTADLVAHLEGLTLGNIQQNGWSDVKDPELRLTSADEKVLRDLVLVDLPELREVAGRLVLKDLELTLIESSLAFAVQQAETAWKSRTKNSYINITLKPQEVLKHLSSTNPSMPAAILTFFVNTIHPKASASFASHLKMLRETESNTTKNMFIEKCYLRFSTHYAGIQGIKDTSLRSKLAADLLAYVQDISPNPLEKLAEVLQKDESSDLRYLQQTQTLLLVKQDDGEEKPEERLKDIDRSLLKMMGHADIEIPNEEALGAKKSVLMQEMNSRLQSTKDSSLMLLLVLILLHAKYRQGVIKATGKYVPKLLKELQKAKTVEEDDLQLLGLVKTSVIEKREISGAEYARLRLIGGRCLGSE